MRESISPILLNNDFATQRLAEACADDFADLSVANYRLQICQTASKVLQVEDSLPDTATFSISDSWLTKNDEGRK